MSSFRLFHAVRQEVDKAYRVDLCYLFDFLVSQRVGPDCLVQSSTRDVNLAASQDLIKLQLIVVPVMLDLNLRLLGLLNVTHGDCAQALLVRCHSVELPLETSVRFFDEAKARRVDHAHAHSRHESLARNLFL